ncbi:lamin tail domain-containing protein [Kutzneria sp. NPDC052558]|uniref:lamin tail domain-containing protein n=1 Tax=Kutzneria sp. NPDC052558 TaxID=3364121 RepID=UPI0037CC6FCA
MTPSPHRRRAMAGTAVTALLSAGLVVTAAPASAAPSADAVIAEVYGGGGNAGATLTSDYIELANRAAAAVSVDGWSVQYLPGAPKPTSTWQTTALTGSIAPGAKYLVGEAKGTGGTTALPTPDATGAVNMSATTGTVALVSGTDPLTCLTAADCAADPRVHDLVGFGGAVVVEGASAPAPSNTTAVTRTAGDTDDNSKDFAAAAPAPTNSKGETTGGGTTPPTGVPARIHDIQGTTRLSPLVGKQVVDVPGIVTGVRAFGSSQGFFFQDPNPDSDPRTSEGIFVYTGSAKITVQPGDSIKVSGKVSEFYPDESGASSLYQSNTELGSATVTVVSSGNPLPPAEVLHPDTVPTAFAPTGGNIENLQLQPDSYALDFFESREGMRVEVDDARVVGPTDKYNELYVTTKPAQNPSVRGGTVYLGYDDNNSGRLEVQSLIPFAQTPFPKANVGDKLTGATAGPLDYTQFGGYVIQATQLGGLVSGGITPETTAKQTVDELAVATYNVENLAPTDPQAKFDRLAGNLVHNLAAPDIVSLEEIQDNSGATDNGVVAADQTLQKFADAVVAAGGPQYKWTEIDPTNDADGGQPGGNIRIAFFYNAKRVSLVSRPGGDATTATTIVDNHGQAELSVSPGRVDPTNPAWNASRKPLAAEFRFQGREVIVIGNHLVSKLGDQPDVGRNQPPSRSSEVQRAQQTAALRAFVDQILAVNKKANIVIPGDFNDMQFSPTVATLTAGGTLRDLVNELPADQRYSYVYQGNSEVLDHLLVSTAPRGVEYDVVHVNAEFADQASDHDPQVVRFRPSTGNELLDQLLDLAHCFAPPAK